MFVYAHPVNAVKSSKRCVFSVWCEQCGAALPSGAGFKSQIYVSHMFLTMWSDNVPTTTVAAIGMNLFRRNNYDMILFVVAH